MYLRSTPGRTNLRALSVLTIALAAVFLSANSALAVPVDVDSAFVWEFGESDSVSIQDLLDNHGGQMQVGDKMFTFFDEYVTTANSQDAIAPGAEGIELTGVQVLGDYGLRFNGGWSAGTGQIADTTITFKVEVVEPELSQGFLIKDNSLWMSAYGVSSNSNGQVSVSENVFASNPHVLPPSVNPAIANKYVYYASNDDNEVFDEQLFDNPNGPSQLPEIWVTKDIVANGGTLGTGSAHISEFYQTFSQTTGVPEPATLALLGMGGLSILGAGIRRRRQRR